ncbi:uncharacterized protein TNCV_2908301 [Trichonephila clavipes]|nr:uncharacterized protein TNCV_2908301 [Trichonephila clavipes]
MRAIADQPLNFGLRSSEEDDTRVSTPSPNYQLRHNRFNVHPSPLPNGSLVVAGVSEGMAHGGPGPGPRPRPTALHHHYSFSQKAAIGRSGLCYVNHARLFVSATRGLLVTDHVISNHGQVTWTTPELAPPLLTSTPHQREDVSALDRFNVHRCPTRRVFSGTGIELMTCLSWSDTLTTGLPQPDVEKGITYPSSCAFLHPSTPVITIVWKSNEGKKLFRKKLHGDSRGRTRNLKAAFTPRQSASSVGRLAYQRLHFARDEVSDWLDAQRLTLTALV